MTNKEGIQEIAMSESGNKPLTYTDDEAHMDGHARMILGPAESQPSTVKQEPLGNQVLPAILSETECNALFRREYHHELPGGFGKASEYREAIVGGGERAGDWEDKPHRLVYDLLRVADLYHSESAALREARADLARERERHQELRQVVKEYREQHRKHGDFRTSPNTQGQIVAFGIICDICKKADALLETKPEPADTPRGK